MANAIAASDLTWLLMDRPNNLMHVHGFLEFDELPEWGALSEAIFERMAVRYRTMTQYPVQRHGRWEWEDDKSFTMERHLRRVTLDDDRPETLRRYISTMFSQPFEPQQPLWDFQVVTGPKKGPDGILFTRFHHGLGDGIRLVQLLLGLCDSDTGAAPPPHKRRPKSPAAAALHVAQQSVNDGTDYVRRAAGAASRLPRRMVATMNPLNLPHALETGIDIARHPIKLTDALTSVASEHNELANSVREVTRLLLHERADTGAWSGHPSGDKSVDWLTGIPLAGIKAVGAAYGGTVNDVLMGAVSLALTAYLKERGVANIHDLAWLMPVSLRPIDANLPSTLGNHFAVVLFEMPLGVDDPARLVAEIHDRSSRLKHSAEATLAFGMQKMIAESPRTMATAMTNYFADKTIGQLTNVPGPRSPLSLAGAPVKNIFGWVPTSGDQPVGVCIFSYNGGVNIGLSVDTRMIPDARRLSTHLTKQIDRLVASVADDPAKQTH